jgi:hypothetical protein
MHARPLPVNMYTYDEDSEKFDDTPLSRAPMRINRRYVPSSKDNLPLKQSMERPEFPLYEEQKIQSDSGLIFPKPLNKFTETNQFDIDKNDSMIYHDFEDEIMSEFVAADPNVLGLLQKTGRAIPTEVSLAAKMVNKNRNAANKTNLASERLKSAPRLVVPENMAQNSAKKKIQI